jgi:hypothetical protein
MDIREAAYKLCKALAALPARTQIAEIIRSLHNTQLSYYGHRQYAQALGYLIINQQREELAARPLPIHVESLQEEKLKVIAGFHKQITDLNESCINTLTNALPNCTVQAVSPYNRFTYNPPAELSEVEIFPKEEAENLVSAFQSHPQIEIAINSASVIPATFSPEYYMQNVWNLEADIQTTGALKAPDDLERLDFRLRKDSPHRTFIRHIAAIASVRASLSVLNELIYQKIFDDKLLVIDETNTIKFGSYYLATGGCSVIYQDAGLLYFVDPYDIIMLKTILLGNPVTKLCRIELLDPSINLHHPGEPRYTELREIDQNLNPYGILFRTL